MNIGFFSRIPVTSLVLLWLAYALLGWYIAAHHIVWLVGAFVAAIALVVVRKSWFWLDSLVAFGSQTLVVILALSASIALIATWSLLFRLFLIPVATTILADLEMRFAGFSRLDSFWVITLIAGLGLGVGEMIDILFLPSSRY